MVSFYGSLSRTLRLAITVLYDKSKGTYIIKLSKPIDHVTSHDVRGTNRKTFQSLIYFFSIFSLSFRAYNVQNGLTISHCETY